MSAGLSPMRSMVASSSSMRSQIVRATLIRNSKVLIISSSWLVGWLEWAGPEGPAVRLTDDVVPPCAPRGACLRHSRRCGRNAPTCASRRHRKRWTWPSPCTVPRWTPPPRLCTGWPSCTDDARSWPWPWWLPCTGCRSRTWLLQSVS